MTTSPKHHYWLDDDAQFGIIVELVSPGEPATFSYATGVGNPGCDPEWDYHAMILFGQTIDLHHTALPMLLIPYHERQVKNEQENRAEQARKALIHSRQADMAKFINEAIRDACAQAQEEYEN